MGFISEKGLVELKNYKYKSGGYSWLDNRMNSFWVAFVEFLPLWLAPNLITFIGFVTMILACATQVYYDVTLNQIIPSWTFYFMAFAIFTYQTLDAVDGKQARRTGSSSPLGQLFDHGCDSFISTFFILAVAQATRMDSDTIFYLFLIVQIGLWAVNQQEYHTGILHTHFYNFGVTELEFICIFVELLAATAGQDIWHYRAFGYELYKWLAYSIIGIGAFANASLLIVNIVKSSRSLIESVPLLVFWALQILWFKQPVYAQLAGPVLINFGIMISLVVCKLIICSTTKDIYPIISLEFIPFIITTVILSTMGLSVENQRRLFWLEFLLSIGLTVRFLAQVIKQITNYLNIYCFKIKKQ